MEIQGKLLVATLVLSLGFGSALLFRRSETEPQRPWPAQHHLQLREEPRAIDLGPPRSGAVPVAADEVEPKATPLAVPSATAVAAPRDVTPPDLPRHYRQDALPVTMQVARHAQMLDDVADRPLSSEPTRPIPRQRKHRVMDGDTLSRLALRYLGSADRFVEIFEANREVLPEPDVLPIGVTLKIPLNEAPEAAPVSPTAPAKAPAAPQPTVAPPAAAPDVSPLVAPSAVPSPLVPISGDEFRPRDPALAP